MRRFRNIDSDIPAPSNTWNEKHSGEILDFLFYALYCFLIKKNTTSYSILCSTL